MVNSNCVKELCPDGRVEARGSLLDQTQSEVNVPEQAPLPGRAERRATPELDGSAKVVEERGSEQKIVSQPRVELRGLPAERGNADGVLEEPAGVAVVPVRPSSRKCPERGAEPGVNQDAVSHGSKPRVRDLPDQELEEPIELIRVTAHRRCQLRRIGVRRGLHCPYLHLESAAETLHPPEYADGVALLEAAVEEFDVVPDPRLDPPARVNELENEVRGAILRPTALLASDRVHALDGAVLRELGDAGHGGSLDRRALLFPRTSPSAQRYARAVADVSPFRAIRYANPTPAVTAPPYDVLTPELRNEFRARDPHNVVHLTLNDSEDEAGRLFRAWLEEGVLVRDAEPAVWMVAQEYVGPDGVSRRREGLAASLSVEPYATGTVLPHERTHEGPKESRLRLLRAAGAQLEPIFLLYDGEPPVAVPDREPDLVGGDTMLWRVSGDGIAEAFANRQLLIADGHHRYETAVAYAAEQGTPDSARMMVVLVSTSDPGLEIFPTHRLFRGHADALPPVSIGDSTSPTSAVTRLAGLPYDRAHAVGYRKGVTFPIVGEPGELDVELVDRLIGHEEIGYTADLAEAIARVDSGEFDGAFLLRATRIEDVFDRARRGEVMPQKTTYFFPKLTSGLLFHPV
jgi:uncharacterized protein (DUF1015 family)